MNRKSAFLIAALFLIANSIIYAQPGIQWQKNFGGSGTDTAFSIKTTADGGFIVAGSSASNDGDATDNHGGLDYLVIKLDASGNILWKKSFGGSRTDIARCIQQTSDGGYVVTGISDSYDGDVTDHGRSYMTPMEGGIVYSGPIVFEPWIVKLDNTGTIIWTRSLHILTFPVDRYLEYENNYANTIIQTSDGGYLVGGNAPYVAGEEEDGLDATLLVKLSNTGFETWTKKVFPGENMNITSLVETADGYTGTGYGRSFGSHGNLDVLLQKTDFSGNFVWGLEYGGTNDDGAYDIQKTSDGGYIVTGFAGSADGDWAGTGNHGDNDFFLLKINSDGSAAWSKSFGGSASDIGKSVQVDADGGFIVAGYSYSSDGNITDHTSSLSNQSDFWLIKADNAGNFLWGKSFGGSNNDEGNTLDKIPGGLIVAGTSASSDAGFIAKGNSDFWVLRLRGCDTVLLPASSDQTFCSASSHTVADLVASGVNLNWYSMATGGTPLAPSTTLVTGTYYVSQSPSPGCESDRRSIWVQINVTPAPPFARPLQVFCKNRFPRVANLIAHGTSLKWYRHATGGAPLNISALLFGGYYYVSQTSAAGCESVRRRVFVVLRHCSIIYFGHPDDVEKNILNVTGASVYPNPSNGVVNVRIISPDKINNAIIQIIDVYGKVLKHETAVNNNGLIQKTINLSMLPGAMYFINYRIGTETGNLKILLHK